MGNILIFSYSDMTKSCENYANMMLLTRIKYKYSSKTGF